MSDSSLVRQPEPVDDRETADQREAGRLGFGLYKYGQGYYVRLLTAIMIGALFLAAAGWAWRHLAALAIPTPTWVLDVQSPTGAAAAGETVQLLKVSGDQTAAAGTATVLAWDAEAGQSGRLTIGSLSEGASPLDANRLRIAGAAAEPTFLATLGRAEGIPAFQRVYLQGGVAAAVLILGGALVYWYAGLNRRTVDFLIATDGEMKKVNWSTRTTIKNSTLVVISATFLIAGIIFLFDIGLKTVSQGIGLLGDV